LKIFRNG